MSEAGFGINTDILETNLIFKKHLFLIEVINIITFINIQLLI